jgi:putative endonuclease
LPNPPTVVLTLLQSRAVNQALGRFGESWAVGYLTRQGYRIVERNVRFRGGELDLVAYDGEELVFVEVKCRRTTHFGLPQESITAQRFRHLGTAIEKYLDSRRLTPASYRVDVVAIEVDARGRVRRHEHLRGVECPR